MFIKKLVWLLFLIPTLCFAKIGDSYDFVREWVGNPAMEMQFSKDTVMRRFLSPDGETIIVIVFYKGCSVVETYFSGLGRKASSETIEFMCSLYAEKWTPYSVNMEDTKCVSAGKIRICYGAIPGTEIQYGLTVLTEDASQAILEMASSPYIQHL